MFGTSIEMLSRNGVQLGTQCSITERKFFDAIFRLSRVGSRRHCHSSVMYINQKYIFHTRKHFLKSEYRAIRCHKGADHAIRPFSSTTRSGSWRETPNTDLGCYSLKLDSEDGASKYQKEKQDGLQRLQDQLREIKEQEENQEPRTDVKEPSGTRVGKPYTSLRGDQNRTFTIRYTNKIPPASGLEDDVGTENQSFTKDQPKTEQPNLGDQLLNEETPNISRPILRNPDRRLGTLSAPAPYASRAHRPIKSLMKKNISEKVRNVMHNVPQSPVVLTTALPSPEPNYSPNFARGMTLSSLTTVTLSPEPIISFNIKMPSHTLDALKISRQFLIHFLLGNKSGAKLAHDLTQPFERQTVFKGINQSFWQFTDINPYRVVKTGNGDHVVIPKFHGWGLKGPILRCEVLNAGPRFENIGDGFVQVGDHVIVLAKVLDVLKGHDYTPETLKLIKDETPLTYYGGKFHKLQLKRSSLDPTAPKHEKKRTKVLESLVNDETREENSAKADIESTTETPTEVPTSASTEVSTEASTASAKKE